MCPSTGGIVSVRAGSSSSCGQLSNSAVRSSPANASVICVPMLAIWITGAIMTPRKRMKETRSPGESRPSPISQLPYPRMSTLAIPMKKVPRLVIKLCVVSVVFTFSKIRITPSMKISPSLSIA